MDQGRGSGVSGPQDGQGAGPSLCWPGASLGLHLSCHVPQAVVLVLCGALLGLSLYGATLVQDGLALTDVVPRGTKEHAFLSAQLRYFSLYEVALVTQGGFDYAHSQRALFDLHQRFSSLKAVLPPPATQAPRTWLHYYRSWLQGRRRGDWRGGLPHCCRQEPWGCRLTAPCPVLPQGSRLHLTRTGLLAASPATRTAMVLRTGPLLTSCSSRPAMLGSLWISARLGEGWKGQGAQRGPGPHRPRPSALPASAVDHEEAGGQGGADST